MSTYRDVREPIRAICREMTTNAQSSMVAEIRYLNRLEVGPNPEDHAWCTKLDSYHKKLGDLCGDTVRALRYTAEGLRQPVDRIQAYLNWIYLVGPGKPWDHKAIMKGRFGEWTLDDVTKYLFNFDIWSNIHYGYVGSACEFSEWELLSGAGAGQVYARTTPPGYWDRRLTELGDVDFLAAFDDPDDQEAIKIGIGLWARQQACISPELIYREVTHNVHLLKTRPAPMLRYNYGYKPKTGFA